MAAIACVAVVIGGLLASLPHRTPDSWRPIILRVDGDDSAYVVRGPEFARKQDCFRYAVRMNDTTDQVWSCAEVVR